VVVVVVVMVVVMGMWVVEQTSSYSTAFNEEDPTGAVQTISSYATVSWVRAIRFTLASFFRCHFTVSGCLTTRR
jgi:hypothetical protein